MRCKNKRLYWVVFICSLLVFGVSGTYGYFQASATSSDVSGTIANFDMNLNITKVTGSGDLMPVYDADIEEAVLNDCLIDDYMLACQIYKIVLTNNGNTDVSLKGEITLTATEGSSITNLKWMRLDSAVSYDSSYSINTMGTSTLVENYTGTVGTFYIVVWDSYTDLDEVMDAGDYTGTVKFTTSTGEIITAEFN